MYTIGMILLGHKTFFIYHTPEGSQTLIMLNILPDASLHGLPIWLRLVSVIAMVTYTPAFYQAQLPSGNKRKVHEIVVTTTIKR